MYDNIVFWFACKLSKNEDIQERLFILINSVLGFFLELGTILLVANALDLLDYTYLLMGTFLITRVVRRGADHYHQFYKCYLMSVSFFTMFLVFLKLYNLYIHNFTILNIVITIIYGLLCGLFLTSRD